MSEYQYFEFLAIDTPLTAKQMDAIGRFSSRAEITATQFTNEYHFGNFKGDPHEFLSKWYDAMVHIANWGTHRFMCRVPSDSIDLRYAKACCVGDIARLRVDGANVIFDFNHNNEDGGDGDDYDGSGYMAALLPIRAEIMAGDLRPLYLAWLMSVRNGEVESDDVEPPVPPGLKTLTPAQIDFAEFLRIDDDLIEVAADASEDLVEQSENIETWLMGLSAGEKDTILLSILVGNKVQEIGRLRRRFVAETASARPASVGKRTVSELTNAAESVEQTRKARQRAEAEKQRAIKQAADAAARKKVLDDLSLRVPAAWSQVNELVNGKSNEKYREAIDLMKKLHDVAQRDDTLPDFRKRVSQLTSLHLRKSSFMERVKQANLLGA